MEYIIFIALFIIAISFALFVIYKPIMKDKKIRNNAMNSDPLTQHYCFALNCNELEAINKLTIHNVKDSLGYTFDVDRLTITFEHLGIYVEHQLSFYIIENKTYLKVSRIKFLRSKSNIPFMINRFFIEKIGAVPVDYTFFDSAICRRS